MRIASESLFSMRDSIFNKYPNICAGQNWPQKSNARPVERELTLRFGKKNPLLMCTHVCDVRNCVATHSLKLLVISLKWNILGQITL